MKLCNLVWDKYILLDRTQHVGLLVNMNNPFFVWSTVFNTLVLFCIRDIHGVLQRMLNLKPNKDQKRYEMDVSPFGLTSCWQLERLLTSRSGFLCFVLRLVLPSSSPKWQKNHIDIKMYVSGVVQVCFAFTFIFFIFLYVLNTPLGYLSSDTSALSLCTCSCYPV